MSPLATALWAWATVHVFAASMSGFLYLRLRAREYAAYGALAISLAAHCMASAWLADALSPAESAVAQRLQALSAGAAFLSMVSFAHVLVRRPAAAWVRRLFYIILISSALVLSGIFSDPAYALMPNAELPWARRYHDVQTPMGTALVSLTGVSLGAWVISRLWPLRRRTDVRFLIAALVLILIGWVHDATLRFFAIGGVYVAEHLASIGGLLVSYLLLANFAQTANALAAKTLELRDAYDELRLVEEELVRNEQLAAVGELSAVIAHEVRNPLAVLRNAMAGLRRDDLPAEDRSTLLTVLDEETDRLNRLVRDLLAYARPVDPQLDPVELEPILEVAITKAKESFQGSFEIEVDRAEGILVHGDRSLLERVFANIASNALQAMPGGGTLTVRVDTSGDAVAIAFEDTGEGMDTLVRSRARDPFFTTRSSGTGLGLAIVERIVKAHGGSLELQSGARGALVCLVLPKPPP
ncbi:MAG: ATP-binding protein [Myxococcota bacterium]